MSVRSFHSVFMASVVAGAALGCYLVSLRVASERAALEQVETQILMAQRDVRLLSTEIGTRARLSQLERWNVRVLALSAPSADQILGDRFQLARLISPERKPAIEAPVILASAPADAKQAPLGEGQAAAPAQPQAQLLHEAGLKLPEMRPAPSEKARPLPLAPAKVPQVRAAEPRAIAATVAKPAESRPADKKAGEKPPRAAMGAMTKPVRTAKVDPLAPIPAGPSTDKASRTDP
ncbi:MAG TPA: hypothetical protein VFO51_02775 [Sphingomicrobium sp.]|nr:hypothetical protein [Sphingomicrobium sp.]